MRLPHWFGFRTTATADSVTLRGRNAAVPVLVLLFASITALPPFVLYEGIDVGRSPSIVILALLAMLGLGAGGAIYSATRVPMRRCIRFSRTSVEMRDACLVGGRTTEVSYASVRKIAFSVLTPRKSVFKLTRIAIRQSSGASVPLIHADCPMYSWQGRDAYAALGAFLAANGRGHLLDAQPNFAAFDFA